ncbi:MAG: PQQ-dependent sugar dehydrogenase [Vicinamibacteria bacterium]|nr:PQQ-dependent sugar dehydrogenase [Vicinamibacteria bacterium]
MPIVVAFVLVLGLVAGTLIEPTAMTRPPATPGPQRDVATVYAEVCAACHGARLEGGKAQTLLDDTWTFGGDDASMAATIREGRVAAGMPAFGALLTAPEIRAMVYYLREARATLRAGKEPGTSTPDASVRKSERHPYRIEIVADGLTTPWGMTFLPDGRLLVSERPGIVRVLDLGTPLTPPITGTPAVWAQQDGGLLDIAIHPDYAANGWIYLAYCEPGPAPTSTTKIVRGKIRDGRWVDQQTIYQSPADLYVADNTHFGSRFLFDKAGHLFFTIGDRGTMTDAQSLGNPNGKIHRVLDDGGVPPDNPLVTTPGALGTIWSVGNRNPQGLAWHPVTGELWSTEHGPRGGDELNVIEKGLNYGWPAITYGINYDGTPITDATTAPGLESPIAYWTPSVAPSGIVFYTGDRFPGWKHDLFIAMLLGNQLRRVTVSGHTVTHQETIFKGFGRVRHVVNGPDGLLYVALNDPGRILRLVPAD